jgi:hypothetical protein
MLVPLLVPLVSPNISAFFHEDNDFVAACGRPPVPFEVTVIFLLAARKYISPRKVAMTPDLARMLGIPNASRITTSKTCE